MSTLTLMRLYLKYKSMPRLPLPCIGYAGTLYSSPLIDHQRYMLMDESCRTTGSPEIVGTNNIIMKKGAIGSYNYRRYSTSVADINKAEKERQDKSKFKLKTVQTCKVMVVSEKGVVSTMTLEEANKLAKKKNLKLMQITHAKDKPIRTEKDVYKLASKLDEENDIEEEDTRIASSKFGARSGDSSSSKHKEVKTVLMKSNIGEHDANAKINTMKKWIKKGHRVRVHISQAGDKGSAETIFQNIETQVTEVEGQIQQRVVKGNDIRFYVGPPKKTKSDKANLSKEEQSGKKHSKEEEDIIDNDESDDEEGIEEVEVRKQKSHRSLS